MKAIILSAGRGSRLLPLTAARPKCLLDVGGVTVVRHQIGALARAGVDDITVITGFLPHLVEEDVARHGTNADVRCQFNPFYQIADNLASCWMARGRMTSDFLLINGDTLFEDALLERVLSAPPAAVSVTVDKKAAYDEDDMKVTLRGTQLMGIGKTLNHSETDAESIGMLRFMGDGPRVFTDRLEAMMRSPEGVRSWFLKAIDGLAKSGITVETCSIEGCTWSELDTPEDYEAVRSLFG
ncbi:sugar phosphate nucleotidyltransferase [Parvularcula dongshanensis]|uniref:Choline kinase n=1 Tax=Parvularcula dongshanensis TaxID=1173995 RepID=A0A840I553_9PROT|nr:phosphocholine cytidylyltransferase family protein [Parvularcula dongshanensis]MBB4659298.1 choline kinase [Parvularcula dongshanensis]